jgi:chromosome partitioning protein
VTRASQHNLNPADELNLSSEPRTAREAARRHAEPRHRLDPRNVDAQEGPGLHGRSVQKRRCGHVLIVPSHVRICHEILAYGLKVCNPYAMNSTGTPITQSTNIATIITVAASKGGVGKTTDAFELAAALGAVAVDLDWDTGGLTRMWGYDPSAHRSARLLDGMETGRAPRPLRGARRCDLVPSHPDLASSSISPELVADSLQVWAGEWTKTALPVAINGVASALVEIVYPYVVVDTHPGANPLTDGAMAAADLVVVPVVLGGRELDALEGMLADFSDYNLLLVPTMVPPSPPRRWVERLARAATDARVPVAPPISRYPGITRRIRRSALTLEVNPGAWVARAAGEYRKLANTVEAICGRS